jgi:hypothetical protein
VFRPSDPPKPKSMDAWSCQACNRKLHAGNRMMVCYRCGMWICGDCVTGSTGVDPVKYSCCS